MTIDRWFQAGVHIFFTAGAFVAIVAANIAEVVH